MPVDVVHFLIASFFVGFWFCIVVLLRSIHRRTSASLNEWEGTF